MTTSLYTSLAGLLFLLCAVVQLNDPDPAFWIAVYVLGGPGLAIAAHRLAAAHLATALTLWLAALVALAAHLAFALRDRLELDRDDADARLHSWLWHALEHELGRELGGTLALIFHAIILRALFLNNNNNNNNTATRSLALSLGVALLASVAFVWFQFQSALVARHHAESPHCSGALSSSSSSSSSSSQQ
jgi:hypothetical protein